MNMFSAISGKVAGVPFLQIAKGVSVDPVTANPKYGRLEVQSTYIQCGIRRAVCICDCGTRCTCVLAEMKRGRTRSCGCLERESRTKATRTHGASKTPEYNVWCHMHARCSNPSDAAYKNYGARGINVCLRWNRFENFILDMGERPTAKHTLERKENDGDYMPENCEWATRYVQSNNRRNNIVHEVDGELLTLSQFSRRFGVSYATLQARRNRGWKIEDVFTIPNSPRS